ncbi:hypothetical protein [Paraburkholderia gardini]|uniref:hypothetical protein n=1 Tax=Paraburkholderia gardini TaxID=2823469 RepID=UPI001E492BB2|nr:hypothetical protein [Paraburkholderia gardini]
MQTTCDAIGIPRPVPSGILFQQHEVALLSVIFSTFPRRRECATAVESVAGKLQPALAVSD